MKTSTPEITKTQSLTQGLSNPTYRSWIPIILILILSLGLRLYQIGTESIWIDENFSIRDAENFRLGTRPLYYLLLRFWMIFGTNDTWLRLLSVPFSLGCVFLTYLLGLKVASRYVGLVAAFLMAVSPLFVGYAQEIRMYSLSTFLTLWGTLALVDILEENPQQSFRSWMIARGLALLTTPLNVLLLLVDLILLGWKFRDQKHRFRKLGKGLILIGLFWLPFAYVLWKVTPKFMGGWIAKQAKPDVLLVPSILTVFTAFWPLTDLLELSELDFSLAGWGWNENVMLFYMSYTLIAMFVFGIGLVKVSDQVKQKITPPKLLWVASWIFLPSILIIIISYLGGSIWRDRYLMFIAPYYLILLAVGFEQIWRYYRPIALAIAAVYFVAVSGGLIHYYTTTYHDDWKGVAQLIEKNEKPGDIIGLYVVEWEPHLSLPRYYKGSSAFHVMEREKIPRPPTQSPIFVSKMLDSLPPTNSRYWIVVYEPWGGGRNVIETLIKQRYKVLLSEQFPNSVNADAYVFLVQPL